MAQIKYDIITDITYMSPSNSSCDTQDLNDNGGDQSILIYIKIWLDYVDMIKILSTIATTKTFTLISSRLSFMVSNKKEQGGLTHRIVIIQRGSYAIMRAAPHRTK